jgi:hypothetical protein
MRRLEALEGRKVAKMAEGMAEKSVDLSTFLHPLLQPLHHYLEDSY